MPAISSQSMRALYPWRDTRRRRMARYLQRSRILAQPANIVPGPRQPPTIGTPVRTSNLGQNAARSTSLGGPNSDGTLSWVAGDKVYAVAVTSNGTTTVGAPSGPAGQNLGAFSAIGSAVGPASSQAWGHKWEAVAAGTGSGAITATPSGTSNWWMTAWKVDGSSTEGTGNSSAVAGATGDATKVVSLATAQDNSAVLEVVIDWNGDAVAGVAFTPVGASTGVVFQAVGTYSISATDWADRGTAGTVSYGITGGGTTGPYTRLAIEILGKASAGGTTFPVSLAGALIPAGGIVKQVQKPLAGASTPASAVARQTAKTLTAAATPAGTLTRQLARALAAGITSAGAFTVAKVALKAFAGVLTSAGTLARQTRKPLAGAATPAGALTKQDSKSFSGSATPAGALTTLKLIVRAFAGSLTPAGSLTKQAGKPLAGAAASAGTLTKQDRKPLAGLATPAGALSTLKAVIRAFAGATTPAAALARQANKPLSGSSAPAGALTRQDRKSLAGTLTPAGAATFIKAVLRAFAGAVTPAGTLADRTGKPLAGAVASAGVLTKQDRKTLTGATAPAGALAVGKAIARSFAGALTPIGTLTRRTGKALTGGTAPSGMLVKRTARTLLAVLIPAGGLTTEVAAQFTIGDLTGSDHPTAALADSSTPTAVLSASTSRAGPS